MDEIDKKILNLMQEKFPLVAHPYAEIGGDVGISEEEAMDRVQGLKDAGIIRRIGIVYDPKKLNLTSILCGAHVDDGKLMDVVEAINRHTGVTHNYEREGDLNLWFTMITAEGDEVERFIADLEGRFSIKIYRFPTKRVFKIKTYFPV